MRRHVFGTALVERKLFTLTLVSQTDWNDDHVTCKQCFRYSTVRNQIWQSCVLSFPYRRCRRSRITCILIVSRFLCNCYLNWRFGLASVHIVHGPGSHYWTFSQSNQWRSKHTHKPVSKQKKQKQTNKSNQIKFICHMFSTQYNNS